VNCLNCGREMMNHLVYTKEDEISYDICEVCGSLWLDAGELNKMAVQVEGNIEYCTSHHVRDDVDEPVRQCPRCRETALRKVLYLGDADLVLDYCANCGGFWLDAGELDWISKDLRETSRVSGDGFSRFIGNTHLPFWYKRMRRRSSETDFEVEVPPVAGAAFQSSTELLCPACGSHLDSYTAFGIEIEGCPACRGLWLDQDELRRLKDACGRGGWTTLRWLDDEIEAIEDGMFRLSDRECPKCDGRSLRSVVLGGSRIIVDFCPSCHGTWLDRGEFRDLVDYLKKQLDELSPREMREKVLEEVREIWTGPEGMVSEMADAKAAISALISITIYDNPALFRMARRISEAPRPPMI